jgi:hypothetical protein
MDKIDWKQKLTSRKFWAAVVGFVTPLLVAFGYSDSQVTEAASIIMAGATLIAYIIGEGLVDSSRISANTTATNTTVTTIKNDKSDSNE